MTQQISAPETQNNEENVKTAMEDIALIKRIINHAEINLRRLGWLFLVYGSAMLATLVFRIVLTLYSAHTASLQRTATLSIILSAVSYAVSIALFILFMRKRRSIEKFENVYTMKLYDMWGVMLFAPVALGAVLRLIGLTFPSSNMALGTTILYCMKYGAIFLLFPLLFLLPLPCVDALDYNTITKPIEVYAYYSAKTSMVSLLLPFVYIGMGIFSLKKQRGSVYGDE